MKRRSIMQRKYILILMVLSLFFQQLAMTTVAWAVKESKQCLQGEVTNILCYSDEDDHVHSDVRLSVSTSTDKLQKQLGNEFHDELQGNHCDIGCHCCVGSCTSLLNVLALYPMQLSLGRYDHYFLNEKAQKSPESLFRPPIFHS